MPEVQRFLRDAWKASQREVADAANVVIDAEIDKLRRKIASEYSGLWGEWTFVGLAFAALAGVTLVALFLQEMANRPGHPIANGLGALGVLLIVVPFWGGIVFVAGLLVWQVLRTLLHLISIETLRSQITSCEARKT